ncbi:M20 family metallopeptidase [Kushneria indalinina]|uniref:Acetylornithine deacetylase/succinyl-diaminopimelate desuccinylase-like protein n=1 Tax=Kushneria indalinina DSM 14324 TaxID=1122140 RepID=A0A3D9DWW4_9GAMM|nr:M20 family metallopeptidase [Kushneria indalinina]REC95135.1 acetylornithine deacetylase/succinyl-diaminopimelate desuccinylase-like protein [Kushneria indalinina DSM 14324]
MSQSCPDREHALALALKTWHSGAYTEDLARRIAYRTVSQNPDCRETLGRYLDDEIAPLLARLGFTCHSLDNPQPEGPPLLMGHRLESPDLPTLLIYGHGDVTPGQDDQWQEGLTPWQLTMQEGRLYGRGVADNKGQHGINLAALETVIQAREGRLGFNLKIIFEMGEEVGSPGLEAACRQHGDALSADLFLASDGPRIRHDMPTLFLGSRGMYRFRLTLETGNGNRHSGNWGGVITNPAWVMTHALSTLVSKQGVLRADCLRAPDMPASVRALVRDLPVGGQGGDPAINADWGEPGMTFGEKLYGANTFEILGLSSGSTEQPMAAIPSRAEAVCQLRFVEGTAWQTLGDRLRAHLDEHGFEAVTLTSEGGYTATRLDPDHPWVGFVQDSMQQSLGETVHLLPNLGGTIPNHCFADVLGLPTVWVPHSYPSCQQHAPNEHLPEYIVTQGLVGMAGIFWDLGKWARTPQ